MLLNFDVVIESSMLDCRLDQPVLLQAKNSVNSVLNSAYFVKDLVLTD